MKIIGLAAAGAMCAGAVLVEDKVFDYDGFDRVHARQGVTVQIVVGDEYSITAQAKSGDIDRLRIRQKGDQLSVGRKTGGWRWGLWDAVRQEEFLVEITMPIITDLRASSGATAMLSGDGIDGVDITASSGSFASVSDVTGGDVALDASSGATLRVSGVCVDLQAEASSGSTVDATELKCATAELSASSGSLVQAWASDTATVEGSSGASLQLAGGAQIAAIDLSSGAALRN